MFTKEQLREWRKRPDVIIRQREYRAHYRFNHPCIYKKRPYENKNVLRHICSQLNKINRERLNITLSDFYRICKECGKIKELKQFDIVHKNIRRHKCRDCLREWQSGKTLKSYHKNKHNPNSYYPRYKQSGKLALNSKIRRHIKKERAMSIGIEDRRFTGKDLEFILNQFDHKCFNCGSTDQLCIDHHYPISKGNPLTRNNAVLLCNRCNIRKHAKLPESFYSPIQLLLLSVYYSKITEGRSEQCRTKQDCNHYMQEKIA